ncbi:MAG TPA: hypothetical protein VFV32_08900 [Acidimicrobiales bacterium]|nr:hypothetical protein [Acidimicrobiales bacterium]
MFPLVGAAFGALAWGAIDDSRVETEVLGTAKLVDVQDALEAAEAHPPP